MRPLNLPSAEPSLCAPVRLGVCSAVHCGQCSRSWGQVERWLGHSFCCFPYLHIPRYISTLSDVNPAIFVTETATKFWLNVVLTANRGTLKSAGAPDSFNSFDSGFALGRKYNFDPALLVPLSILSQYGSPWPELTEETFALLCRMVPDDVNGGLPRGKPALHAAFEYVQDVAGCQFDGMMPGLQAMRFQRPKGAVKGGAYNREQAWAKDVYSTENPATVPKRPEVIRGDDVNWHDRVPRLTDNGTDVLRHFSTITMIEAARSAATAWREQNPDLSNVESSDGSIVLHPLWERERNAAMTRAVSPGRVFVFDRCTFLGNGPVGRTIGLPLHATDSIENKSGARVMGNPGDTMQFFGESCPKLALRARVPESLMANLYNGAPVTTLTRLDQLTMIIAAGIAAATPLETDQMDIANCPYEELREACLRDSRRLVRAFASFKIGDDEYLYVCWQSLRRVSLAELHRCFLILTCHELTPAYP